MAEVILSDFPVVKILSLSLPSPTPTSILSSLEGSHREASILKEVLCSTSLRVEYRPQVLAVFLYERLVPSPTFAYLFNHLFTSAWTHGHVFYSLRYKLVLLYLFCYSDCSVSLSGLLFPFDYLALRCGFLLWFGFWARADFWLYKVFQAHRVYFLSLS